MNNIVLYILIFLYIIFVFFLTFYCYVKNDNSCCKPKKYTPIKQDIQPDV